MNREGKAFLANISSILVKDIGIDKICRSTANPNSLCQDIWLNDDGFDLLVFKIKKLRKKNIHKLQNKRQTEMFERILKFMSNLPEDDFPKTLRITKISYKNLFKEIKCCIPNIKEIISKPSIFCIGLIFVLAEQIFLQNILKKYVIDMSLFYKIIFLFYNKINKHIDKYIKWPIKKNGNREHLQNFSQSNKKVYLEEVYGIISSKKINMTLQNGEIVPILIQLTCNINQIISSIEIRYVTYFKFYDTKVGKCILNDKVNNFILKDSYLVGANNFPLSAKLITPFKNVDSERKYIFNKIVNNYINIAETVFQKIFQLFPILENLKMKNFKDFKTLFKTICVIYNQCLIQKEYCELSDKKSFEQFYFDDGEEDMAGLIKRQIIMDSVL